MEPQGHLSCAITPGIRHEELKKHRIGALLQAVSSTVTPSISILATIVTFMGYTLSGKTLCCCHPCCTLKCSPYSIHILKGSPLNSAEAFTIFSVFNAMQFTVGVLPFTVRSIAEAKISLTRIQKLLELPEHQKQVGGLLNNNLALQIKSGDFAWEVLNIDFKQKKPSGASDPSAANSKMKNGDAKRDGPVEGEGKHTNGHANGSSSPVKSGQENAVTANIIKSVDTLFDINLSIEKGKLIVTQQAWIYNDTFRENILIGQQYNEEKYKEVLRICSLESDIELLASGESTEIGERGTNLRYWEVFLEKCDEVVVMQEGKVVEKGTHTELLERKGEYFDMVGREAANTSEEQHQEEEETKEAGETLLKTPLIISVATHTFSVFLLLTKQSCITNPPVTHSLLDLPAQWMSVCRSSWSSCFKVCCSWLAKSSSSVSSTCGSSSPSSSLPVSINNGRK
ncbi:Multidrug resistance-associated protein 5 [Portunus trituberculatus]|uniref:Multidrug resistance-associated protein 5 n=1 Tax=Portunus trituberculatus TaxID=210409 RepID=A0A5B7DWV0_PORTR|nr:Multidrug resistance-associated protein 5 [Portunus trituberculatus]